MNPPNRAHTRLAKEQDRYMSHVIRTLAAATLAALLISSPAQADDPVPGPPPCSPSKCPGEPPMSPPLCDPAVSQPMFDEIVRLNQVVRVQERRLARLELRVARKNLVIQGLRDQLSAQHQ